MKQIGIDFKSTRLAKHLGLPCLVFYERFSKLFGPDKAHADFFWRNYLRCMYGGADAYRDRETILKALTMPDDESLLCIVLFSYPSGKALTYRGQLVKSMEEAKTIENEEYFSLLQELARRLGKLKAIQLLQAFGDTSMREVVEFERNLREAPIAAPIGDYTQPLCALTACSIKIERRFNRLAERLS